MDTCNEDFGNRNTKSLIISLTIYIFDCLYISVVANTSFMIRELKIIELLVSILLPFNISAQLEIGTQAPQFYLEGIYQNGRGNIPTLETLKGEIIVLDFWAIWCSPCVAAIPENNELSKDFKEQNVKFIAITDDPKDKLENFLKKVQIDFLVGRDDDKQDFNSYKVLGRPQMYIINRDGIIVYHGPKVTSEMLEEVIATNSVTLPKRIENLKVITDGGFSPGEDPLYNGVNLMLGKKSSDRPTLIEHFIIRPSLVTSFGGSGFKRTPDGYFGVTIYGGRLPDIFLFLYRFTSLNWIRNNTTDTSNYDIIYWKKTKDLSTAYNEIEQRLLEGLLIRFDSTRSLETVNVLSIDKPKVTLKREEEIDDGTYKAYTSIQSFVSQLEDKTNQFFLVDQSLEKLFVFNKGMERNKMYNSSPIEIVEFLNTQGITIKQEKRAITLYEINNK